MATEIIYIDANRQMSKRSDTQNNIWEYKLGSEALVLPAGTQITIQDTFVNKRGAGGQSIEIDEDIDEMVDMGYYINDSPQWVPIAESESDPNVENYEHVFDNSLVSHGTAIRFKRNPIQKYMGWQQNIQNAAIFGKAGSYVPEMVGGSNTAFPCVHMNGGNALNQPQDYKNCDIRPFTNEVNVFIPKGVYGLTELATLVTDQMTGKLTNVRNGDFVQDYIARRLNRPAVVMDQNINDNESTYVRRLPLFSAGAQSLLENFTAPYADYGAGLLEFKLIGSTTKAAPTTARIGIPTRADDIFDIDVYGYSAAEEATYLETPLTDGIPKCIHINGEYFYYTQYISTRNDGRYNQAYGSFRNVTRGVARGETAAAYAGFDVKYQLLDAQAPKIHARFQALVNYPSFGPNGSGRIVIQGTIYGRFQGNTGRIPDNTRMRFPNAQIGFFTTPESYRELMRDIRIPTSNERYETTTNRYKASVQLQARVTPPSFNSGGANPVGADSLQYNYGSAYFGVDYMDLYRIDNLSRRPTFGQQAKNFDYNPLRRGYFVGTPEFQMNWDADKSSFTINYLHQSHRIPSHDQYANIMEGDGTEAVEMKRLAQKCRQGTPNVAVATDAVPFNPDYIHPTIAGSLEHPQRRLGGIAVYNWARNLAQRESDIDWQNPELINPECVGNGPDDFHSGQYLTFADYFSKPEKAKAAWGKSIWAKLGFTYDQMANPDSFEQERRYDVIPDNPFDIKTFDMRLYGMTTTADMSVSMNPTISTAYNDNENEYHSGDVAGNIRAYNNCDINTPFLPYTTDGKITKAEVGRNGTGNLGGSVDNSKSYFGSMYKLMTSALITTQGKPVQAQNLPTLNNNGYLVVNSDIVDTHSDSIKNGQNMCMLGLIPLGSFASQDFITSSNQMVHIIGQDKVINSIKINIVNPDLTPADLDANSSVIIKIVRPVLQPPHITNTRVEANNGN